LMAATCKQVWMTLSIWCQHGHGCCNVCWFIDRMCIEVIYWWHPVWMCNVHVAPYIPTLNTRLKWVMDLRWWAVIWDGHTCVQAVVWNRTIQCCMYSQTYITACKAKLYSAACIAKLYSATCVAKLYSVTCKVNHTVLRV
jgi:hypothetical protein